MCHLLRASPSSCALAHCQPIPITGLHYSVWACGKTLQSWKYILRAKAPTGPYRSRFSSITNHLPVLLGSPAASFQALLSTRSPQLDSNHCSPLPYTCPRGSLQPQECQMTARAPVDTRAESSLISRHWPVLLAHLQLAHLAVHLLTQLNPHHNASRANGHSSTH